MGLKRKGFRWLCLLLAVGCLWACGASALAADTVTVTARYAYQGADLDAVEVRLYYVAALDRESRTFTPEARYAAVCTEKALTASATARGNRSLAEALIALIDRNGIEPTVSGVTRSGNVCFDGLAEGLYLLRSDCPEGYTAEQAVICLPQWDASIGEWLTESTVTAKVASTGGTEEDATPSPAPEEPGTPNDLLDVDETDTPLANFLRGLRGSGWALVNLICTILTVLDAVGLLCSFFNKPKEARQEEAGNTETRELAGSEEAQDPQGEKRRRKSKLLGTITAVLAVVTFILTEDIRQPMGLVDRWTWLMALYLLLNALLAYLTRRKKDQNEAETETSV